MYLMQKIPAFICRRSRYSPGLTSRYSLGSSLWLMFYRECSVSVESTMGIAVPEGFGFGVDTVLGSGADHVIGLVGVSCAGVGCCRPGWPACLSQDIDGLFPRFAGVTVDEVAVDGSIVWFRVRAKAPDAACSCCGRRSSRLHARYRRQLSTCPARVGRSGSR